MARVESKDCSVKFFHRTTEKAWKAIQAEGVLWGVTSNEHRYTYLSPEIFDESYGPVVLEVEWEPQGAGSGIDNYGFDPPLGLVCWQFAVFVPIPLSAVRRVSKCG